MIADTLKELSLKVSQYFLDFLESDFKRQQAPRRRVMLQNSMGIDRGRYLAELLLGFTGSGKNCEYLAQRADKFVRLLAMFTLALLGILFTSPHDLAAELDQHHGQFVEQPAARGAKCGQ